MGDNIPQRFLCPISQSLMHDPVQCKDGHNFERKNIQQWLRKHTTCPISRKALIGGDLVPNRALKEEIDEWKVKREDVHVEPVATVCTECDAEDPKSLWFQMQHSTHGVRVTNRRHHLKLYKKVFVGSDAVTWIAAKLACTREEAVKEGQKLMDEGLFYHIKRVHKFEDKGVLFRFTRHDSKNRLQPKDFEWYRGVSFCIAGFRSCPFYARAVRLATAMQNEVADPRIFKFQAKEFQTRSEYSQWLREKRRVLGVRYGAALFHSSSPLVYIGGDIQNAADGLYIGGLEEFVDTLSAVPRFARTNALERYSNTSHLGVLVHGLPVMVGSVLKHHPEGSETHRGPMTSLRGSPVPSEGSSRGTDTPPPSTLTASPSADASSGNRHLRTSLTFPS